MMNLCVFEFSSRQALQNLLVYFCNFQARKNIPNALKIFSETPQNQRLNNKLKWPNFHRWTLRPFFNISIIRNDQMKPAL